MTYLESSKNITEFLLEYIQTPKMILAFKKHPLSACRIPKRIRFNHTSTCLLKSRIHL